MRAIWLSALLLLCLVGCDAGPSAVLPDGAGKAPAEQVQPDKAPVWAQKNEQTSDKAIEEASMPMVDAAPPVSGEALPVAATRAKVTATRYGDWPLWSQNRKYSADENAHYHFEKHGPEFSAKSYTDYMAMVHGFIHAPPAGTQTLKRSNGDTLFYDPKGNVFAVMTKAGAPRTMFRPDNGAAYWRQQKIIESQRRTPRRESYGEGG
jgi:pyocin large subunit-like protein